MKLSSRKPARFVIVFGLSLFVAIAIIASVAFLNRSSSKSGYSDFYVNGRVFGITYIAANESQWLHGLMNTTVTNSTTMLFEFGTLGDYPFWMYDTYTNLDMIWVDYGSANGTIVYIERNATSCFVKSDCVVYDPGVDANYVIEAKAGFVERNNISVGDSIVLR
jgi:uncharacterized membrane protein (UPF0127 family)